MSDRTGIPGSYGQKMEDGTQVVFVTDVSLAAALVAVGIKLRQDPPYFMTRKADGTLVTRFYFLPCDESGELKTTDLVKAWSQDVDFIQKNPLHPFTFAMCALRNLRDITRHLQNDVPYVMFNTRRNGKTATLFVKEGSAKHGAALKRGLTQV